MSYQVSARKWRPQNFEEVVGQEYITRTLKNALDNNRISHAYLFSGMHGVGKTTLARILAKALNCRKGPTSTPCNECDMCKEITAGASPDVIEIDGASNTGVDDVRDLRERVRYSPSKGKYKVYIVDEVHMLSKPAFNAFLKTLEEPPSHTVFIFATTETQKIPETVQSRCQCFEFKKLSSDEMAYQLKKIAEMSGIIFDEKGIGHIIKRSQGSMRDALVSFDQAVSYAGKSVSEEQVKEILGITGITQISSLFDSIISGDVKKIITEFTEVTGKGADLKIFCRELMEYTRNLAIAKRVTEPHKLIDMQKSELDIVLSQAVKLDVHAIQSMFQAFLKLDLDIKQSSNPALVFEMSLIRISTLKDLVGIDEILKKISILQSGGNKVTTKQNEVFYEDNPINETYEPSKTKPKESNDAPPDYSDESCPTAQGQSYFSSDSTPIIDERWNIIKDKIGARKPIVGGILENMKVIEIGTSEIILGFGKKESEVFIEELDSASEIIKEVITEVMGREMTLVFREPEKVEKKKVNKDNENWKKQIVQNVLDYFPGTVIEHSVHKGI